MGHETEACGACQVGEYASGKQAVCSYPQVSSECSSAWSDALFTGAYGAAEVASLCTFQHNHPAFAEAGGAGANCSFAGTTVGACYFEVQCDSPLSCASWTTGARCDFDLGLSTATENCTALELTDEVACAFSGQVENCTACPAGTYCDLLNTVEPKPCEARHPAPVQLRPP